MKLNIPVGVSDFEELRKREYYYVDKTGLIFELLKNSAAKVTLLTRPRRFGKTLAMNEIRGQVVKATIVLSKTFKGKEGPEELRLFFYYLMSEFVV